MKSKAKEEILNQMVEVMPFELSKRIYPYILEAMDIHAQNRANKTLEDVELAINELEISDGYIKADHLKEKLKSLKL